MYILSKTMTVICINDEAHKAAQLRWNLKNMDKVRRYGREHYARVKDDPEKKAIRNARECAYYQVKKERLRLEKLNKDKVDITPVEEAKLKETKDRKEGVRLRKKMRDLEQKIHELGIN